MIYSFGFKRGPVPEGFVIFDVRRINDPDQDQNLRDLTGLDESVQQRILQHELAEVFLRSAQMCVDASLSVAFGCNQGRHRSVSLAELLARRTNQTATHRDWSAQPHGVLT